jgi:transcriptional regulator with XRE-family HTH domain
MEEQYRTWARNIANGRKALGLSQAQLAERVAEAAGRPLSQQSVARWEAGHDAPRDLFRAALATVLSQDVAQLFPAFRLPQPGAKR